MEVNKKPAVFFAAFNNGIAVLLLGYLAAFGNPANPIHVSLVTVAAGLIGLVLVGYGFSSAVNLFTRETKL
jgi:hypothetical protein